MKINSSLILNKFHWGKETPKSNNFSKITSVVSSSFNNLVQTTKKPFQSKGYFKEKTIKNKLNWEKVAIGVGVAGACALMYYYVNSNNAPKPFPYQSEVCECLPMNTLPPADNLLIEQVLKPTPIIMPKADTESLSEVCECLPINTLYPADNLPSEQVLKPTSITMPKADTESSPIVQLSDPMQIDIQPDAESPNVILSNNRSFQKLFEKPLLAKRVSYNKNVKKDQCGPIGFISVSSVLSKNQCPSLNLILRDQAASKKWPWSIKHLKKWFGSKRDLSLCEVRFKLYQDLKDCIPALAGIMEKEEKPLGKESARAISEFRDLARTYSQGRSWRSVEKFLNKHENKIRKTFEERWIDKKGDVAAIIEDAMKSNSKYNSHFLLRTCDTVLKFGNKAKFKIKRFKERIKLDI